MLAQNSSRLQPCGSPSPIAKKHLKNTSPFIQGVEENRNAGQYPLSRPLSSDYGNKTTLSFCLRGRPILSACEAYYNFFRLLLCQKCSRYSQMRLYWMWLVLFDNASSFFAIIPVLFNLQQCPPFLRSRVFCP